MYPADVMLEAEYSTAICPIEEHEPIQSPASHAWANVGTGRPKAASVFYVLLFLIDSNTFFSELASS